MVEDLSTGRLASQSRAGLLACAQLAPRELALSTTRTVVPAGRGCSPALSEQGLPASANSLLCRVVSVAASSSASSDAAPILGL